MELWKKNDKGNSEFGIGPTRAFRTSSSRGAAYHIPDKDGPTQRGFVHPPPWEL